MVTDNVFEMLLYLPLRIAYFLFSPFYFLKITYVIGFLGGLLNFILIYFIIKYRIQIFTNYLIYILLLNFVILSTMFAIFTGSSGTAFRHRSKFDFILVLICVPVFENYFNKILNHFILKK